MCYKKFRRSWVKQSKIYHFRGPWIHLGLIGGCPLFSGPLKCLIRRARSHYIDHPGIATLPCHFEFGKSLQSSFLGILQTFTFGLFLDMSWRLVIGQIGFPHLCFFHQRHGREGNFRNTRQPAAMGLRNLLKPTMRPSKKDPRLLDSAIHPLVCNTGDAAVDGMTLGDSMG